MGTLSEKNGGKNSEMSSEIAADRLSMIEEKTNLCRLCLLKMNRFDKILQEPRYKMGPNGKRVMTRMDRYQRKILMSEFQRNANWSQEMVEALAARLEVPKAKVYKWNWD